MLTRFRRGAVFGAIMITLTTPGIAQPRYDAACRPLAPQGWIMQPQPPSEACLQQRALVARTADVERKQRQAQTQAEALARQAATGTAARAKSNTVNNAPEQSNRVKADLAARNEAYAAAEGDTTALERLQSGATAGDASAQYALGQYYFLLRGQKFGAAILFTGLIDDHQARLDPTFALVVSGLKHSESDRLYRQAISYFEAAARNDDPAGEAALGNEYLSEAHRKMAFFSYFKTDPQRLRREQSGPSLLAAIAWACGQAKYELESADKKDWAQAATDLGLLWVKPIGLDEWLFTGCFLGDTAKSDDLLARGAMLGDPNAILMLIYKERDRGGDIEKSAWLKKLRDMAESGDRFAKYVLTNLEHK
jgi:hypothetical protein